MCYMYFFPLGVYVGTLNLIPSIPDPSILTSYCVYISQLIRFARDCKHVADFNARNKCLTAKPLDIGIIKFEKRFLNFIADTLN